jgi:hypothetical protein
MPGDYASERALLRGFYAAKVAGILTCCPPADRAASLAALRAEEHAALRRLADKWSARRRVERQRAFASAGTEIAARRPQRPSPNKRRLRARQFNR